MKKIIIGLTTIFILVGSIPLLSSTKYSDLESSIHLKKTKKPKNELNFIQKSMQQLEVVLQKATNNWLKNTYLKKNPSIPDSLHQNLTQLLNNKLGQIRFEKNSGQFDEAILYQTTTNKGIYRFLKNAVSVLMLEKDSEKGFVWNFKFENSLASTLASGRKKASTTFNYLQASRQISNVPTFNELWYEQLYRGIDLRFYDDGEGNLKYDFIVLPDAKVDDITMALEGIEKVNTNEKGDLIISTPLGIVRKTKPYAYQIIDGKTKTVAASFLLDTKGRLGFKIGDYNKKFPLIIDPTTLVAATYFPGFVALTDLEVTAEGVYIAGTTTTNPGFTTVFPITAGVIQTTRTTNSNAEIGVIARISHDFTQLDFGTYLGTVANSTETQDMTIMIEVENGALYVAGTLPNLNFSIPTSPSAFQQFNPKSNAGATSPSTAYAIKLTATADSLLFGTYLGSDDTDTNAGETTVDLKVLNGKMYITGTTVRTSFPITTGAYQSSRPEGNLQTGFLSILAIDGSSLEYSTYLSGSNPLKYSIPTAVEVDAASGSAYVGGYTNDITFPTTANALYQFINMGSYDAFLVKIDPAGNGMADLEYATGIGDISSDRIADLAADGNLVYLLIAERGGIGRLPLVGNPYGTADTSATTNGYLAKINTSTGTLEASSYIAIQALNGIGLILNTGRLELGDCSDIYVTGLTFGGAVIGQGNITIVEMPPDGYQTDYSGFVDGFVIRLDNNFSKIKQGTLVFWGCNNTGLHIPTSYYHGHIYIAGYTQGSCGVLPTTPGVLYETGIGIGGGHISKFSSLLVESMNDTICDNTNYTLSAEVCGGVTPYSYRWIAIDSTGVNAISDTTILNPTINLNASTTFLLQVTDSVGTVNIDTVHIGIVPSITSLNAGEDQYICSGDSVTIGSHNYTSVTYSWSPPTGLSDPNVGQPKAAPTMTTIYTLTYTDCDNNMTTDDVTVFVNADPATITDAGTDPVPCLGDSVMIGTPEVPTFIYEWSPAASLDNPNLAQPTILGVFSNETYTVTVTSVCTGASSTSSVDVTLELSSANAGEDKVGCPDTDITLGNVPNLLYTSYSWERDDGSTTGITNPTSANPTFNLSNPGTYTVILTTTSVVCDTTRDEMQVILIDNTPVANAGLDMEACVNWPDTTTYLPVGIGTPAADNFTYSWTLVGGASASAILNDTSLAEPIAIVTDTTHFELTVTSICDGSQDKDTVIVTIPMDIPNVDAYEKANPNVTTICPQPWGGDFIGMTGEAHVVYAWSPQTALYPYLTDYNGIDAPSVIAKPFLTTRYTLTATDTCSGKSNMDTVLVIVEGNLCGPPDPLDSNAAPVADISESELSICEGESVEMGFPDPGNPNITYQWSPTDDLSHPDSSQTTVVTPTSGRTYTLVATNTVTGISNSDQITIIVHPQVLASAGPSPIIFDCVENVDTMLGPAIGATAFENPDWEISWQPTNGLSDSTALRPRLSGSNISSFYEVTVTDPNTGCTSSAFVVIEFSDPFADAGPDTTICLGNSVQIGTPALPGGFIGFDIVSYTYNWSPTDDLDNPNTAQPLATPSETTTYTVTVTESTTPLFGGSTSICNHVDDITVTVTPVSTQIADAGVDHLGLCPADADVSIGANTDPGVTYAWTPSTALNDSTLAMPTVDVSALPIGQTTYTLTVTDPATSCTSTDEVVVELNITDPPTVMVDSIINACPGTIVTLSGASVPSGYDFQWVSTDDPTLAHLGLSNTLSPKAEVQDIAITYYLEVFDRCGGSTVRDSIIINPLPAPVINGMGTYSIVCPGGPLALSGVNVSGATTFTWFPPGAVDNASIQNPNFIGTTTTTLTLTARGSGGCTDSETLTIEVDIPPANAGPDQASCIGTTATIGTTGDPATYNYAWSIASGPGPLPGVTNTPQIDVDPTGTTSYVVTVSTIASSCPSTTDTVEVVVPAGTPTAIAGTGVTICPDTLGAIQLGTDPEIGMEYSWFPPDGLTAIDISNPKALPDTTITYTLRVTNPCSGLFSEDQVTITVLPVPEINAGADMNGCAGDTLHLGTTDEGYTYSWSPTTGLSDPDSATSSLVLGNLGPSPVSITYTLTADDGSGCIAMDEVVILANPVPEVNYEDVIFCQEATGVTLNGTISGTSGSNTTIWTPNQNINDNTASNPTVNPDSTTVYTLLVRTSEGCIVREEVMVTVDSIDLIDGMASACIGGSAVISTTNIPGATYSWTGPNSFTSSSRSNSLTALTAADFGTYQVTATSIDGCTATAAFELSDFCSECAVNNLSAFQTCHDNGTPSDSSDDYITLLVTADTINGISGRYEVVLGADAATGSGGTVLNSGGTPYGTSITVGTPTTFVADGSTTYDIVVRDQSDDSCFAIFTTVAVENCSNCPPIICLPFKVIIKKDSGS